MSRRSGKPYDRDRSDRPMSLVQKMTQRVSKFLPTQISSWLTSTNSVEQNGPENPQIQSEPQAAESPSVQVPTAKRQKTDLNVAVPQPAAFPSTINTFTIDDASTSSDLTSSSRAPQEIQMVEDPVEPPLNSSVKGIHLYGLLFDPNSMNNTMESSKGTPQPPAKSRKFAFDPSIARSPSICSTSRHDQTRSPFYQGKTCYGGASAYRRSLGASPRGLSTNLDLNTSINSPGNISNRSWQLRPQDRGLNSTVPHVPSPQNKALAERILKAVESVTPSSTDSQRTLKRRLTDYESPLLVNGQSGPPIRSLNAPTVRDMMQQKVSVARSLTLPKSKPAWKETTYALRQEDKSAPRQNNKMKRNEDMNELPEPVDLPQISLNMRGLPSFDFAPPPVKLSTDNSLVPFTFSDPIDAKALKVAAQAAPKPSLNFIAPPKTAAPNMTWKMPEVKKTTELPKTSSSGFGDMFKKPAGTWSCSSCMVDNKADAAKCVACNQEKTPSAPPPSKPTPPAPVIKTSMEGFGNKFKKPEGNWECSMCMVSNKADADKCVACEHKKAGSSVAPAPTLNSLFKKPEGNWECPSCMISNKADVAQCVACTQPKPSGAVAKAPLVSTPLPISSFSDKFKKPAGTWDCSVCMVNNKADALKCVACETASPNAPKLPPVANSFGDQFKKAADKWSCPVCMVVNAQDLVKCQACQAENPSKQKIKTSASAATPEKPKFMFGIQPSAVTEVAKPPSIEPNKDLFSFGVPKDKKAEASPSKGFVFGDSTPKNETKPSFTFGVPPEAKEVKVASPAAASAPLMMINPPSSTAPKLKRKAVEESSAQSSPPKLAFPSTNSQIVPQMPSFSFNPSAEPFKPTELKKPTLVEPAKPAEAKKPSFSFMNEDEEDKPKNQNASVQSLFGPVTNKSSFSFAPAAPKEADKPPSKTDAPPASLFSFGPPAGAAKEGFSSLAFAPPVKEVKPAAPTFDLKPSENKALEPFKSTSNSFSFGNDAPFKMGNSSPFQTEQKDAPPPPSFFQAAADKPVAPAFGAQPSTFSSPVFGTPSSGLGDAPSQFSLPKTPAGGFNFGNNQPAGGGTNIFAFGAAANKPADGGFCNSSAERPSMFAAAVHTPAIGAAAPPAFGDMNKPTGGFSFNSNAPNVLQPLLQTNANTPIGGFNFASTVPKFNPDIRPTFNFSNNSGVVFNATNNNTSTPNPNAAMQARKIRKATRRIQPR